MIIVSCKVCGKNFKAKTWHLQQGWSKCCSKRCRDEAQKKGKFVSCGTCGKRIWRSPKSLEHPKSGKFFCTKSCQTLWRNKVYSGQNHAFWIDGYSLYRKKLLESSTSAICRLCGERDKRVLQAHHRDGNEQNSKINNLVFFDIEHTVVHLNCDTY